MNIRIGCAGWTVPKEFASVFNSSGSHLERYARCLSTVEINSSFYRSHRPTTYARWAQAVPDDFSFAVKVPLEITHTRRLEDTGDLLSRFLEEIQGLGTKLGALLVQLPPSLVFDGAVAGRFFGLLRGQIVCTIACEPRHESWLTPTASELLKSFHVARVAADPAIVPSAAEPGGWERTIYFRLHGSPRTYYSSYATEFLDSLQSKLKAFKRAEHVWCIFDNTALGAAIGNALTVENGLRLPDDSNTANAKPR